MNVHSKRRYSGFTLAELLVVVAIIAVLVAIAIPVFGGALTKARAATCAANRRSLKSELTVEYMMDGTPESIAAVFAADKDTFICPSGGTITYKINANKSISVSCSFHTGNAGTSLADAITNSGVKVDIKHRVDSKAEGPNIKKLLEQLQTDGTDLDELGAKAWAYVNSQADGKQIVWTDQDITNVKNGTAVRVICYNVADNSYYTGYSNVTTNSDGVKIIAQNAEKNGYGLDKSNQKSEKIDTYEEAFEAFQKLNESK